MATSLEWTLLIMVSVMLGVSFINMMKDIARSGEWKPSVDGFLTGALAIVLISFVN